MSALDAWIIQETLKQEKIVNVPWVQHTFSVSYLQAKDMVAEMERRDWLSRTADRRGWRVMTEDLFLRRLDLSETETLCEELTAECLSVLECLQKAEGGGVPYEVLKDAVHGSTDTNEALHTLAKLKLVFCSHEQLYYSCISTRESRALTRALRRRQRREAIRGRRDEEAELTEFRQMLWRMIRAANADEEEA